MRGKWRIQRDQRLRRRRGYLRLDLKGSPGYGVNGHLYLTQAQARELARQLEARPKGLRPPSRDLYKAMLEGFHGLPDRWVSLIPMGIYTQGHSLRETKRALGHWARLTGQPVLDQAFLVHTPSCKAGAGC